LICVAPPSPPEGDAERLTEFGLQHGKEDVQPGVTQPNGTVRCECDVRVKRDPVTKAPNFLGPYAYGTPAARFLYLSWRREEGGEWHWIRRLKIHLASITWEQIEAVGRTEGSVLEARIAGTGSGTVPLLGEGWTVRDA
jgi:hypothetical protein